MFAALGIFPGIPGVGGFLVGSPLFPMATVHLANGALVIRAPAASADNRYVHALRLQGAPHDWPWIDWKDVANSAVLDFDVSSTPDPTWGAAAQDAPPQLE